METYALYVSDDRYSVPTLVLVSASSAGRARAKAQELLLESQHHLSVEVSREGATLFTVGERRSFADAENEGRTTRT